jgi:dTDP-4-dehydrorhamnose reductase
MTSLLVLGMGYSSGMFIAREGHRFDHVAVTTRYSGKAQQLRDKGIQAHIFEGRPPIDRNRGGVREISSDLKHALRHATHLLVSTPPDPTGDHTLETLSSDISAAPNLRWIAYLSTVGVYGDHGGAWVDETTPCKPESIRSNARIVAEEGWLKLARATGKTLHILRLSGIYGPGRNAFVNLREGRAHRYIKDGQVFNRIHVADISNALIALLAIDGEGGIWNVTDNEPAPPQDVVVYAAGLMGVEPPPEVAFADANLSPMGRSFYGENKRVSNRKLREELGVEMLYPTYREALTSLWESGEATSSTTAEDD